MKKGKKPQRISNQIHYYIQVYAQNLSFQQIEKTDNDQPLSNQQSHSKPLVWRTMWETNLNITPMKYPNTPIREISNLYCVEKKYMCQFTPKDRKKKNLFPFHSFCFRHPWFSSFFQPKSSMYIHMNCIHKPWIIKIK